VWLYPLPAFIALAGWIFLLGTSEPVVILFGLATLALGVVVYFVWARRAPDTRARAIEN
jgi:positive regulator of sigma E activity